MTDTVKKPGSLTSMERLLATVAMDDLATKKRIQDHMDRADQHKKDFMARWRLAEKTRKPTLDKSSLEQSELREQHRRVLRENNPWLNTFKSRPGEE